MDVTGAQWQVVEPLIGEMPRRADGRGRPWRSSRDVLNGILWILRTGAQWADLPERYPPCHPAPTAASSAGCRMARLSARSRR